MILITLYDPAKGKSTPDLFLTRPERKGANLAWGALPVQAPGCSAACMSTSKCRRTHTHKHSYAGGRTARSACKASLHSVFLGMPNLTHTTPASSDQP